MTTAERIELLEKAHEELQKIATKYGVAIEGSPSGMTYAFIVHHEPNEKNISKQINVIPF